MPKGSGPEPLSVERSTGWDKLKGMQKQRMGQIGIILLLGDETAILYVVNCCFLLPICEFE